MRTAVHRRRHAGKLLRGILARCLLASLTPGVILPTAGLLFPTPYEWLTGLPVGMGMRDDAAWAFNVGTV